MAQSKKTSTPPISSLVINSFGAIACAWALVLGVLPDEKLSRLKLLSVETGVVLLVLLAALFWVLHVQRGQLTKKSLVDFGALSVWVGGVLLLWAWSTDKALASLELRRVLLGAGAFLAFRFGPFPSRWIKSFLIVFSFGAFLMALYGILQRFGGVGPIVVPQMERVMGSFGNPIFFAAYLVLGFFVLMSGARLIQAPRARAFAWMGAGVILIAIYLTETRAAWIALLGAGFVGFVLLGKNQKSKTLLGLLGLIILGSFLGLSDVWDRDQGHLLIWRDTVRMGMDHPIRGVGIGSFHAEFPAYAGEDLKAKWPKGQFIVNYAHNEFLQVFSEGGFFGVLLFVGLLGVFSFRFLHDLKTKDSFYAPLGLGALALLIQNFFSVDFRFSISFCLFFMALGLALREEGVPAGWSARPLVRGAVAGPILVFFGVLLLSKVWAPYQARSEMNKAVGFFESRLVNPKKTIETLERALEEKPASQAELEQLAYVYAKEIKDETGKINPEAAKKAIEVYERIIRQNPMAVGAWNNLGNIYYTLGQRENAIERWEKVLEINPEFLDVLLNLGKIHYVNGDLKKSARYFERVLDVSPNNAEAQVYLRRMVE